MPPPTPLWGDEDARDACIVHARAIRDALCSEAGQVRRCLIAGLRRYGELAPALQIPILAMSAPIPPPAELPGVAPLELSSLIQSQLQERPTTCHMPRATCHMPRATCHMPRATCHMPRATCHVPRAKCQMPNAKCQMPNAKCQMPHTTDHIPLITYH